MHHAHGLWKAPKLGLIQLYLGTLLVSMPFLEFTAQKVLIMDSPCIDPSVKWTRNLLLFSYAGYHLPDMPYAVHKYRNNEPRRAEFYPREQNNYEVKYHRLRERHKILFLREYQELEQLVHYVHAKRYHEPCLGKLNVAKDHHDC